MTPEKNEPWLPRLFLLLFVFRAIALTVGLDRLPLVSFEDEALVNDPALALSQGFGFVAFSYAHTLPGLERLYAWFPPLYILLQSLIFRSFGFCAITMRASSVVCDLAACAAFIAIVWELHRRGIVERRAALVYGVILLLNPDTLAHGRMARMEPLYTMLGGIALYLALRASRRDGFESPLWIASAAIMGLALATHLAAIVLWVALAGWSVLQMRRVGRFLWVAVNAIPFVVLGAVWTLTYRARSLEAYHNMREIIGSGQPPPTLLISGNLAALRQGSISALEHGGGFSLFLVLAALTVGLWRVACVVLRRSTPASALWTRWLFCLSGVLVVQCALLQFVIPHSGSNRMVVVFPVALLCAVAALSHLAASDSRRAMAVCVTIAVIELAGVGVYLGQLTNHWAERSAERFEKIVDSIPPEALVAGEPELWLAFRQRGRNYNVIYDPAGYWAAPDAFRPYDVVILDPEQDVSRLEQAAIGKPVERSIQSYKRTFVVFEKQLPGH